MTSLRIALLWLPAFLLAVGIVFNVEGIVLKEYAHDRLGYWRQFGTDPILPLIILPFAALPFYAAIRCMRTRKARELSKA